MDGLHGQGLLNRTENSEELPFRDSQTESTHFAFDATFWRRKGGPDLIYGPSRSFFGVLILT
jgi:hypothetical protein